MIVRVGQIRLKIFAETNGKYRRWSIRWTPLGQRRQIRRRYSNLSEAKTAAREIAATLAAGQPAAQLSPRDLDRFRAAVLNLASTGQSLETVTAQYAAACTELVQSGVKLDQLPPLPELARAWLEHRPADNSPSLATTTQQTVETFLLNLRRRQMSGRHTADLRDRLRRWARDNPGTIGHITGPRVQTWALALDLAPRTRNNYLAAVQTLFADAELSSHPHTASIRAIKPVKIGTARKEHWRPDEMRSLLHTAEKFDPQLISVLVLGAFAKLRASEAARATAADLRLSDCQMIVRDGKTGSRLVALPENCVTWLSAYAPKDGPLWPASVGNMNNHCRKLAARCHLKWRSNALRKSAQTYALLLRPDYDQVSAQAGNSPSMMRRYYVDPELATKTEAQDWFSILPMKTKSVIVPLTGIQ